MTKLIVAISNKSLLLCKTIKLLRYKFERKGFTNPLNEFMNYLSTLLLFFTYLNSVLRFRRNSLTFSFKSTCSYLNLSSYFIERLAHFSVKCSAEMAAFVIINLWRLSSLNENRNLNVAIAFEISLKYLLLL